MYRGVIIYAPETNQMDRLVARLRECFDRDRFKVEVKTAGQAAVPDLARADLFLLGSLPEGKDPIHPDFAEILRALSGITLAGRVGGLFTVDSEATLAAFRRALQDCELALGDQHCRNFGAARLDAEPLETWVAGLVRQLESQTRGL